mmetsp:Transcript_23210/g.53679  ORF Transcript_23210/g.53679 Transcript_23210/m.53679 type:complete len:514 (+) Transcript_23210:46-1587(+)
MGGLDYYDLTDRHVRKHQADLAREYGVHGFMFYHYWFNGENVKNSTVMWKIPHLMLQDGQPDLPFFFSWANRRWERGYGEHATGEVLIDQDYSNETAWREHFNYLLPYFQQRLYKKIDNKPIFAIYFPQEIGDKLGPMMNNWHELAKKNGFNGIYFLRTVSGAGGPQFMPGLFDASFHFMAVCERCGRPASGEDKDFITTWPQYWGATTGFDNRVRGCSSRYRASPEEFKLALQQSFSNMSHHPSRRINENLFFIAAWNEWNEQGVLEPDDAHAFAYLKALQDATETIAAADPTKREAAEPEEQHVETSLLELARKVRPDKAWGLEAGSHKWNETKHGKRVVLLSDEGHEEDADSGSYRPYHPARDRPRGRSPREERGPREERSPRKERSPKEGETDRDPKDFARHSRDGPRGSRTRDALPRKDGYSDRGRGRESRDGWNDRRDNARPDRRNRMEDRRDDRRGGGRDRRGDGRDDRGGRGGGRGGGDGDDQGGDDYDDDQAHPGDYDYKYVDI